jgi:DNA polymerase-3 subunit alpha
MSLNHCLSARSDFSIGESLLQIDQIVEEAARHGYESVALMDIMGLHALPAFTGKMKAKGLRPIIGCTLRVYDDPTYRMGTRAPAASRRANPFFWLKVYVLDERGVTSLFRLLSRANSAEYFYYHARCGLDDVLALKGVAVSTGDLFNPFARADHLDILKRLRTTFGRECVFVELVPVDTPLFDTLNARAIKAARHLDLPTLVTYPALYREPADAGTLEAAKCIAANMRMDVSHRPRQFVQDFVFAPIATLLGRVKAANRRLRAWSEEYGSTEARAWVEGVGNIETLAGMCVYEFKKKPPCLPKMAENEFALLGRKCIEGWKRRFAAPVLGYLPPPERMPIYTKRLNDELATLKAMGFSGYFLLVEDLVTWAKAHGVRCGPGRGSSGGCLVAYLLGITDVDPVRFNLLFERFINPERLDLPDADLDFMTSKRHLVVRYLVDKYGADRVAGISNYSTLASASALRDVGRLSGMSPAELAVTKLIPREHGQPVTLTRAAWIMPEIEAFRDAYPKLWAHALRLEGAMRSFGQHAAGVVVAGEPLIERAVVETRLRDSDGVVNWDKRAVEDWGLIKMDLLGLSTLDVLEIAQRMIRARHGVDVDYLALPLEEADVMEALGRGDTTGVFQLSSPGMKRLLRALAEGGRLTFEDVVAATALFRPGPMDSGLMDEFVAIRQGLSTPHYDHPCLERVLGDTHGIVIYQEQTMAMARELAGFTGAQADHLRKAIGKKDAEKMARMKDAFIDGAMAGFVAVTLDGGEVIKVHRKTRFAALEAPGTFTVEEIVERGYTATTLKAVGVKPLNDGVSRFVAEDIWNRTEANAQYQFNRSHAVEYSVLSVWTAWLRVRYPAEYFAACLSIVDEDRQPELVKDARECGIEVLPPDINLSTEVFGIVDDRHILAPFSVVKGVSEATAKHIVALRATNRNWKPDNGRGRKRESGEKKWIPDESQPIKGRFDTPEEFMRAAARVGSKVNVRVVENLCRVGACAGIDPSAKPARDVSRRRDQIELMPGIMIDAVKADRVTDAKDEALRAKLVAFVRDYKCCEGCSLAGNLHPATRVGDAIRFMVVTDCPNWQEEREDRLLAGDGAKFVKTAIIKAGLRVRDGYYTTLVKAKKSEKTLTNEQINGCRQHLSRELELIRPAVIVALGRETVRHFLPGEKAGALELAGRAIYVPALDVTVVCGINPQQCFFDPEKKRVLLAAFRQVAEIVS